MKAEEFKNPGAAYRGKPFWAWNGRLDPDELRRQVRIFKKMGLGGGFMHSRTGLDTAYLGPEWFRCVRAAIDECRREGLEAWLYDEDRWPSGAAGGLATKEKRYRMRRLGLEIYAGKPKKADGTAIRTVRGTVRGAHFTPGAKGRDALVFFMALQRPSAWYNGQTYLDTMSKEAVRKFIAVGYEPYAKDAAVRGEFGRVVPGIFTDEPNHGGYLANEVPWTDALPGEFKKRYGYDVRDRLPALFFETDDPEDVRARWHFHDLTTALFVESFAEQIGAWCGKRGLLFAGHVLEEGTLASQTRVVGAAMRFYEYMQTPGIDVLMQYNLEYDTAKQCSSVARQMGGRRMLSELYGCTGWHFTFEGHKASGDWQAALGVNLRCQHLSWYTMRGEAKRDYPASIFHQSPWWREYSLVEDYFARVNWLLTRGEAVRDVLVVHPIESQWLFPTRSAGGNKCAEKLQRDLDMVRRALLGHQIDFDYGDEEMLSRLARVAALRKPRLVVGKAAYRAVVVPPALTLRASTVKLLEKFRAAGGDVLFAGEPPALVDALPCEAARELAARCLSVADPAKGAAAFVEALAAERTAVVVDGRGRPIPSVLVMKRRDGARTILFMANTDRRKGFDEVAVSLQETGCVEEWRPETGEVLSVARGAAGFATSLAPSGSRMFVVAPRPTPGAKPRRTPAEVSARRLPAAAWAIALDEPNALVLDMPRWRVAGGAWRKPREILRVDRAVREALGVARRAGWMVQPWARPPLRDPKSVAVELEYAIEVALLPSGPVALAIETPERFRVALNGVALVSDEKSEWWVDASIVKLPVPPSALARGRNVLRLAIEYTEADGLEACFLLGGFGVKLAGGRPVVAAAPRTLRPGDWVGQGLPFYSGCVTYRIPIAAKPRKGERVFVRFDDHRSTLIRVFVNGRLAGAAPWPPYEVELTGLLGGRDELAVEVFPGRRNAFGPLHLTDHDPAWTGPEQFVTDGRLWSDAYQLLPYGLMKPPVIVRKK